MSNRPLVSFPAATKQPPKPETTNRFITPLRAPGRVSDYSISPIAMSNQRVSVHIGPWRAIEPVPEMPPEPANIDIPDTMYVAVPVIIKTSSAIVFLICLFSLATSLIAHFNLIHPLFSLLACVAAIGFYIMGSMISHGQRSV